MYTNKLVFCDKQIDYSIDEKQGTKIYKNKFNYFNLVLQD